MLLKEYKILLSIYSQNAKDLLFLTLNRFLLNY